MTNPSVIYGAVLGYQDGSGNFVPVSAATPLPMTAPGGGTSVTFVAFPASSTASGSAGQMAYSSGFAALCVATDTWVFWATSSDYPL